MKPKQLVIITTTLWDVLEDIYEAGNNAFNNAQPGERRTAEARAMNDRIEFYQELCDKGKIKLKEARK